MYTDDIKRENAVAKSSREIVFMFIIIGLAYLNHFP